MTYVRNLAGNMQTLTNTLSSPAVTFATLPAAPDVGTRAFVTDATVATFASAVVGGGSNKVPVFYDGAWKIG